MKAVDAGTSGEGCVYCGADDYAVLGSQPDLRYLPERAFRICRCRRCGTRFTLPRLGRRELDEHYPPGYGAHAGAGKIDAIFAAVRHDLRSGGHGFRRAVERETRYSRDLDDEIRGSLLRRAGALARNLRFRGRRDLVRRPKSYAYLLPYRGAGARTLHVGSGEPRVLATHLLAKGLEVHLLDIHRGTCEALSRNGIHARCGTTLDVDYPERFFDVVFCSHVLEHVLHPREELLRLRRWLRDDGILVCGLPVYGTLEWGLGPTYYDVPRHQIHPTPRGSRRMFRRAGLRVRRTLFLPYGWGFFQNRFLRSFLAGGAFDPAAFDRPLPGADYWRSYALSWLRQSGSAVYYLTKRP